MKLLANKVALVTGAGSGIGRASAIALAREGAQVAVTDIDSVSAKLVADEIQSEGGRAQGHKLDVANEQEFAAIIERVVQDWGGLDVLHNNAADTRLETIQRDRDVCSLDTALWNHVLAVALTGTMYGCKYAIPKMLQRGGGTIVNTSSRSGERGNDVLTTYSVAKAGINQLTRHVATQYGKQGIRCNAVAPGVTLTESAQAFFPGEALRRANEEILTPYLGQPEDIASVVVFLASDQSRLITGAVLMVDGGGSIHAPYSGTGIYAPGAGGAS